MELYIKVSKLPTRRHDGDSCKCTLFLGFFESNEERITPGNIFLNFCVFSGIRFSLLEKIYELDKHILFFWKAECVSNMVHVLVSKTF